MRYLTATEIQASCDSAMRVYYARLQRSIEEIQLDLLIRFWDRLVEAEMEEFLP